MLRLVRFALSGFRPAAKEPEDLNKEAAIWKQNFGFYKQNAAMHKLIMDILHGRVDAETRERNARSYMKFLKPYGVLPLLAPLAWTDLSMRTSRCGCQTTRQGDGSVETVSWCRDLANNLRITWVRRRRDSTEETLTICNGPNGSTMFRQSSDGGALEIQYFKDDNVHLTAKGYIVPSLW